MILTGRGVYRGRDGLQALARLRREELPDAEIDCRTTLIKGVVAFLEWAARSGTARVDDGAVSFVIRDLGIAAQTTHYPVARDRKG